MKWIAPKYSKSHVKRAGTSFVKAKIKTEEFESSIPVLMNWRASHAFPMQIMLDLLRKNVMRIDKSAIVVQRLKRIRSIAAKLLREGDNRTSLSRMEDIAGCRAVLSDVRFVFRTQELLQKSRTKHQLVRVRDYISSPKPSGYRGIHIVFKYNGSKTEFSGLPVELQIRSRIQHSWATAVEVVGTFTKQALKASGGEKQWLDMFILASVEFAKLENCHVDPRFADVDTSTKLKKSVEALGLLNRLGAFRVATRELTDLTSADREKVGYFILLLDIDAHVVRFTKYSKDELEQATENYDKQETQYRDNPNVDLVMVSANSVRDLKRAYPNYFSDTEEFSKLISQVLEGT